MDFPNQARPGVVLFLTLLLVGCATPSAKDPGGRWRPVNQFQETPSEIPLASTYVFYASPMDGTLKAMLTRWAEDTGVMLSYRLAFDYTLYKPVADIRTSNIYAAIAQLNAIYAAQRLSVTANGSEIVVQEPPADTSHPERISEPNMVLTPAEGTK